MQVNFLTKKKIFLTAKITIPVQREITNYTLSHSNAFLFVRYEFGYWESAAQEFNCPWGNLKTKINEIPEYKFLNIKVLGKSNKVPTLLSFSLLLKHYLKKPPCFLYYVWILLLLLPAYLVIRVCHYFNRIKYRKVFSTKI